MPSPIAPNRDILMIPRSTSPILARFEPFRGQSIEVAIHELFTTKVEPSRSSSIKANQG
jgi:hypothetical protein